MIDQPAHKDRLVTVAVANGVADVTLDRPAKRNASRERSSQLTAAVAHAAADASVRLVVFSAQGPAFCAGMDLDEMQNRSQSQNASEEWEQDASDYRDLLVAILRLDFRRWPSCMGRQSPADLASCWRATSCWPRPRPASRCRSPNAGSARRSSRRSCFTASALGPAMPILLAGQVLSGEDAYRIGLCHALATPENLEASRQALATPILAAHRRRWR